MADGIEVQFDATVPTVADRIAQEVARRYLEPRLEPAFHANSYGYKPGKSAIDAVRQARQRCWRHDWVLDLDVKAYFDSIDWELTLRAVRRHTNRPWVLLYIERWLKACAASREDEDRLLQGCEPTRRLPYHLVRLSGIPVSGPEDDVEGRHEFTRASRNH